MSSPAVQIRNRVPRIAAAAVEKARLTVVPRARSRAPKVPFVTLVQLVLISGVIGLLLFNTSMQQASFAATSLENQADGLAAREQTLQMELEDLRNPQRVATQAQEMGMVVPAAPDVPRASTARCAASGARRCRRTSSTSRPPAPIKPKILAPAPTIVKVTARPPRPRPARHDEHGQNKNKNGNKTVQGRPRR